MSAALLIDFGSTFTKLRAIDLADGNIIGSGQGPSTVETDVTEGLSTALADLEGHLGALPNFKHRLACSSAAGGLGMVTVGLVRELTAEAAKQAALGAGAKLTGAFSYGLTKGDIADIERLAPDIILLAGGTDGGNAEVILENAAKLAAAGLTCPVVIAGNREAAEEVAALLEAAGSPVIVTENVMPEFGVLNVEPARAAIRQVFIDRIVHAKGIDKAAALFDAVLMPTPAAVLEGARLLSAGHGDIAGLGPLVVVDVGGATTDVHSVADGAPTKEGVIAHGLPEPHLKRTVEGDLGMRINAAAIAEAAGLEQLAAGAGLAVARAEEILQMLSADIERLPDGEDEQRFDQTLAEAALKIAMTRHAGSLAIVQTVAGPVSVQTGKDLGQIKTLIGTGGVLAHGKNPAAALMATLADPLVPQSLKPQAPDIRLDKDYVLFAVGLLAEREPEAALTLGIRHMHSVT
ncbi:MAG: methylaspartate mutase accessory protein GlmL [Proteobacteria bacterium]|nr:methylaspartate mutase accessory protein GlmL [Pseudomonadota bacterium]MDA1021919.1 methylaspartate mutase accessory protein GlmL [Pseudomonadota bacterium]